MDCALRSAQETCCHARNCQDHLRPLRLSSHLARVGSRHCPSSEIFPYRTVPDLAPGPAAQFFRHTGTPPGNFRNTAKVEKELPHPSGALPQHQTQQSQLTTNGPSTMICRPALSRGSQLALRRQGVQKLAQRGFAAAASPKTSYEPTTIAGVKVAARDDNGPTTRLAVVAKAGTRYELLPGLTVGLEEYAFKARILILLFCCPDFAQARIGWGHLAFLGASAHQMS
jgi:hypothetical protein